MLRNTTVDSAMPLSLVSLPLAMRGEVRFTGGSGSAAIGSSYRAHSALVRLECSRLHMGSPWAISPAGAVKGGIRLYAAAILEQPFEINVDGGPGGMALMALSRDHESAFVSKVTYGRSHDPAVRRRRGEG